MTPLQQAAQAVIARWESPKWKDEAPTAVVIGALLKALTDEQAQSVEPVAWMHPSRDPHLLSHSAYTYGSASVPLYLHPSPPAGERVKVGDSQFESWYSELQQAGKGSKQIAREAYEAGLNEAQQVAVPMTEAQIFACDPVPHVMFDQQRIDFARAIEAFHGITGAKS